MKSIIMLIFFLIPICVFAQDSTEIKKPDRQIRYMYKNQFFPFDSGVAMSDPQYQFLFRTQAIKGIQNTVNNAIENKPKIVYVDRPVRNKGDGNKIVWFLGGTGAGIVITTIISAIARK